MIAIIGAGISGLSLAHFLQEKGKNCTLIEASDKAGGLIQTIHKDNHIMELGPNALLCDAFLMQFLEHIGLKEAILFPNEIGKSRYILKKGIYKKLPSHPLSLIFSSFFSWKTKLKIFKELRFNHSSSADKNETVEHFFLKHFNQEVVDYVITPFISGIYAGNPKDLLIDMVFPQLIELEKKYGSLLKGLIHKQAGKRKLSVSFSQGMQTLPQQLSQSIHSLRLKCRAEKIIKENGKLRVYTNQGKIDAEKVVLALPFYQAQHLLNHFDCTFQKIVYAPIGVVHSSYMKKDIKHPMKGFGALHPLVEDAFSLGSIWSSRIFPNRCPEDQVLLTTFLGGVTHQNTLKLSEEVIFKNIKEEHQSLLQVRSEPLTQYFHVWEHAIPQYNHDLKKNYPILAALKKENIFFDVNWQGGVSVGDCIKKSYQLAQIL